MSKAPWFAFRSRRQTLLFRYAVLALCFSPLFFIHLESYGSPFINALHNGAHIGVFFVVGWALLPLFHARIRTRIAILVVATLVGSLLIEGIQEAVGRAFQWIDIYRNFIGLGLGIALRARLYVVEKHKKTIANLALVCLSVIFLIDRATFIKLAVGQVYFSLNAPVLAEFDYAFEQANWRTFATAKHIHQGELIVTVNEDRSYAGVAFTDFPANWNEYSGLVVEVDNPNSANISLTVKITDRQHDVGVHHYDERYNGHWSLPPGRSTLEIPIADIQSGPKHRLLNIGAINRIDFFLEQAELGTAFKLASVKLRTDPQNVNVN
ncbi:hypothetical protein [Alteromonas flava]|uniref:hypothetical protein n=1 Tax=Alteromonas flava TaxID=2048003 RepID=UPI000C28354C|nr:hypothetical protein [Alteromonas flava]